MIETPILELLLSTYRRMYRVTLTPTRENIEEALRVYDYGVKNNLGLIATLREIYGYRYRRMENFLRELGLWEEGRGWRTIRVSVNIYNSYVGRESIHVDLYFEVEVPVSCVYQARELTPDTIDLFYEMLYNEGYGYVPFEEETVGLELLGWGRALRDVYQDGYQSTIGDFTSIIIGEEKIKGYAYKYKVRASRYHPFFDMEITPSYEAEEIETRKLTGRELTEVMRKWGI